MTFDVRKFRVTSQLNNGGHRLKKLGLLLALPLLAVFMVALAAGTGRSVPVAEASSVKGHFFFYPRTGTTDLYYASSEFQNLSVQYRLHVIGDPPTQWQTWQTNPVWLGTYDSSPITCGSTVYSRSGHWTTPFYDDATYDDVEFKVDLYTTSPSAKNASCTSVSPIRMTASAGTHPAFSMPSGTYPAIFLSGLFPP